MKQERNKQRKNDFQTNKQTIGKTKTNTKT